MSELQDAFNAFARNVSAGNFSDPDPRLCGCNGSGWFLSDFDTWHECPQHPGRRHPEDQDGEDFINAEQPQWTWSGPAPRTFQCIGDAGTIGADLDLELNDADIPF